MKDKKKIISIVLIIFLVLGWGSAIYLFIQLNAERTQTQVSFDKLGVDIKDLTNTNKELNDDLQKLQSDYTTTSGELENALKEIEEQKERADTLLIKNSDLALDLRGYKNRVDCDTHWDFNYKSNASMSSELKELVGEVSASAQNASWDIVWNNASTAIHNVWTDEYLFVFLVSYEKDFTGVDSVFWVDNWCYVAPE